MEETELQQDPESQRQRMVRQPGCTVIVPGGVAEASQARADAVCSSTHEEAESQRQRMVHHQEQSLSGWILPSGSWHSTREWWHISALYDLQQSGLTELNTEYAQQILKKGDEEEIRNFVAEIGFVKISRRQIDGASFNRSQLATLKMIFNLLDLEEEFTVFTPLGAEKVWTIEKIMKLRNPAALFL